MTSSKPAMLTAALTAGIALIAGGQAVAQNFPQKPVRTVIGYTPGGTTDVVARIIGQKLTELWGQSVIVDSRPGAAGNIGAENIAKSPADGYSMLLGQNALAVSPAMYTKMAYDVQRDLATVTSASITPHVILLHPSLPARNVKELIALGKKRPNELLMASTGHGNSDHMVAELFNTMAGLKITHVPYKGNAPALADLVGGHVDMAFNGLTSVMPLIKSGRLRVLGVTSIARTAALPEVQTLDEQGLKGFQAVAWNGLTAPARTPKDAIAKTADTVARIIKSPEFAEQLKRDGSDPVGSTTAEFVAHLRDEVVKWKKVLDRAGIKSF